MTIYKLQAKDVKDTAYYDEIDDTNRSTLEHHEHPGQGGVATTYVSGPLCVTTGLCLAVGHGRCNMSPTVA